MSYLFETKRVIERKAFKRASSLVEEKIKEIRSNTPNLPFEKPNLLKWRSINSFMKEKLSTEL